MAAGVGKAGAAEWGGRGVAEQVDSHVRAVQYAGGSPGGGTERGAAAGHPATGRVTTCTPCTHCAPCSPRTPTRHAWPEAPHQVAAPCIQHEQARVDRRAVGRLKIGLRAPKLAPSVEGRRDLRGEGAGVGGTHAVGKDPSCGGAGRNHALAARCLGTHPSWCPSPGRAAFPACGPVARRTAPPLRRPPPVPRLLSPAAPKPLCVAPRPSPGSCRPRAAPGAGSALARGPRPQRSAPCACSQTLGMRPRPCAAVRDPAPARRGATAAGSGLPRARSRG